MFCYLRHICSVKLVNMDHRETFSEGAGGGATSFIVGVVDDVKVCRWRRLNVVVDKTFREYRSSQMIIINRYSKCQLRFITNAVMDPLCIVE